MPRWPALFACVTIFPLLPHTGRAAPTDAAMSRDVADSADHKLVGRYQGSTLLGESRAAFDEIVLPKAAAQGSRWGDHKFTDTVTVQGRITRQVYAAPRDRSALEVATNYADALKAHGMEQVFACAGDACGEAFTLLENPLILASVGPRSDPIHKGLAQSALEPGFVPDARYALFKQTTADGDTYVAVLTGTQHGGTHGTMSEALDGRVLTSIVVAQPRAMEHKIVTVTAAEIADKLSSEGRVAFYGIYFDFDKAEVKPDSDVQLAQMAAFIKAHGTGRVFITGHTDNQGGLDYNLALSQRRAEAVEHALSARYGVDARRMSARGLASLAPLAANASEAGRAKNRRVELVAD